MPIFSYKAKKENAEPVSGEITALNADQAVELLVSQGLIPVAVVERSGGVMSASWGMMPAVRARDISLFTRQMVGLLKSGVPLLQAVEILARQSRNKAMVGLLSGVSAGIRNGRSFSACLMEYPESFSPLYVAMARAGEESGRVRELLANMVVYFRKQEEIASKVRGALAYPIFMLVVGTGTVFFILTVVMPRITVLFDGMNARLPWATLFVMGLSQGIVKSWPFLAGAVFLGILFWRSFGKMAAFRQAVMAPLLAIPFFGDLVLKSDTERFARTLGLLLGSGIPILRALEVAIPTLGNEDLKKALWLVQERVSGGSGFGDALRDVSVLPEMFSQLISVGEESGALATALNDIADAYEQEISEFTRTATTLLEPAMILVVGAVVGFIVFAMLMPIFQMDIFAR